MPSFETVTETKAKALDSAHPSTRVSISYCENRVHTLATCGMSIADCASISISADLSVSLSPIEIVAGPATLSATVSGSPRQNIYSGFERTNGILFMVSIGSSLM
jgi:hypothetical protein